MTTKPSPFNGKWGLTYSSDFNTYMDAYDVTDDEFRQFINSSLSQYEGDDRLFENFHIEGDTITRIVWYKNKVLRESKAQPFDQLVSSTYFDGNPIKYIFGREGGRDDIITRFELGNNDKVHAIVIMEVLGENQDQMQSTYFLRGRTYIKKWVKV